MPSTFVFLRGELQVTAARRPRSLVTPRLGMAVKSRQ